VPDDGLLTIEQLAARTGLTVRNIRSHVTRGLLPPAHLKGRTGYYGPEHVARLELVTGLQQQGFNLAAIEKLVGGPAARSAEETVAFYRSALGPWLTEAPEIWDEPALAAQFGIEPDDAIVRRLQDLGLMERLADGRLRVRNPALIRAGRQLASLGYRLDDLLGVLEPLLQHSSAVAAAFVRMFTEVQWSDYVAAGMPAERLPELQALIDRLRPLATQAVVAAFQQAMTDVVDASIDDLGLAGPDSKSPQTPATA
jgi:DNA-binding transcriptional MerR regulator